MLFSITTENFFEFVEKVKGYRVSKRGGGGAVH